MTRMACIATLDRLGLLKYVLAFLFTALAFTLTAGAFLIDDMRRHPAKPKPAPAAWLKESQAPAAPGWVVRAPVAHAARFTAVRDQPAGFAFYDITARDTPETLSTKLARKQFQVGRGRGESCDFATPLSGRDAPSAAVADFIRSSGRDCCGMAQTVPNQLATYVFGQGGATSGPITGTAVFSAMGGGLLTLTLRFAENVDGYANAITRHLGDRLGRPQALPGNGASWTRDGGLVTLRRAGRSLVVTAYYAANIERHAALARDTAARKPQPEPQPGGRLAMAVAQ